MNRHQFALRDALEAIRSEGYTKAQWDVRFNAHGFVDEVDRQLRDTKDRTEAKFRALLMFIGDALVNQP